MRFRSIRWRLATTYVLFTIFVVGLVGLVAISLVREQTRGQEEAYLRANATVLALQAAPLFGFHMAGPELQALAETAAFLGNSRVKILDAGKDVIADSGQPTAQSELIWLGPSMSKVSFESVSTASAVAGANWMILPAQPPSLEAMHNAVPIEALPATDLRDAHLYGVIQRAAGGWGGGGFSLELMPPGMSVEAGVAVAQPSFTFATTPAASSGQPRSPALVTVPIGDESAPTGFIELSEGPDIGAATLTTTYRAFGIAAACAVLVALAVSLLVSRRITAPLAGLTAAARHMSDGDLASRAPPSGRDEVGQLALQFNAMAARLQASFAELAAERDTLRRFVADASHELRTPITALKTFNELLQSYTADDPAARSEFLGESQAQLDRLETIVHHLLDLSRLDAQLVPLELVEHDSGELLEIVARRSRALALDRGQRIAVMRPDPAPLLPCDRVWLELALANLVDNALKFSPPGAAIEIGVSGDGAGRTQRTPTIELWVRDQGAGIDPADQPHIFERFYRGRSVREAGSGLGLAIVQSVVQAHGGRISLNSAPGAGSRFAISLPLQAPAG